MIRKSVMIAAAVLTAAVLMGDKVQYKTPEGAEGAYEGLVFSAPGEEPVKLMTPDGNILYVTGKHVAKIEIDDKLPNREDRLAVARLTERNMLLEREKMKLQKVIAELQDELDEAQAQIKHLREGRPAAVVERSEDAFVKLVTYSNPQILKDKGRVKLDGKILNTGRKAATRAALQIFLYDKDGEVVDTVEVDLLEGKSLDPGAESDFQVDEKLAPETVGKIVSHKVVIANETPAPVEEK